MIRYIFGDALDRYPLLRDSMFRDRAAQFRARLHWDVTTDAAGHERDQYDALNPLYVVWQRPDGRHGGSLRYMPTTGRTMLAEHFPHLVDVPMIRSPHIWECTRFCLAPCAPGHVSAALMLGGLEAGLRLGLSHAVGVFDERMIKVYRRLGWPPAPLGSTGEGRDRICAGLWAFEPELRAPLARRAGIAPDLAAHWYHRAFGEGPLALAA
ncbi:acyl-homoserine-lactone synthase [Tranquillimonas alkanivorans]|uniref:Acyl-homoserine-lactone synthase n=1 Tax=Tranquillimonas alkanivorans TaxID=441119 RepID=A0A1I5PQ78_9RHOB|nr:acyl-homoserine-lactone synthase [Tranquillimonas alkanivorans]SFP36292.1 N-acyl-L-homoserine lactone synthetase [Tranquillimonas alkanivorans]